jgi:hypothetical protein
MKTLIELGAYLLQHARQHLEVLAAGCRDEDAD